MKCQEIEILLSAYIDGEVTEEEKHLVEAHLNECDACQTTMTEFSRLHTFYSELEKQEAPAGFRQRVTQRLEAQPRMLLPWRWPRVVYAVSCALFVLVSGVFIGSYILFPPDNLDVTYEVEVYAEDILFGQTASSLDDLFSVEETNIAEEILNTIGFPETNT
jgi:predicted anti-sigma-YlaC factor YlaD